MSSHIIENIGHIFRRYNISIPYCSTRFTLKNSMQLVRWMLFDMPQLSLFTVIAKLASHVLVYVNKCAIRYTSDICFIASIILFVGAGSLLLGFE
jgi:hypothetical protein